MDTVKMVLPNLDDVKKFLMNKSGNSEKKAIHAMKDLLKTHFEKII
jgi:hypothetical protein